MTRSRNRGRPPPRDDRDGRDDRDSGRSYRPLSRDGPNSLPPRPPPPSSRLDHGRNDQYPRSRDSYDNYRDRRNDYTHYPPPLDTYRPPQGDFTFRAEMPQGVQFGESYRSQDNRDSDRPRNRRDDQRHAGREGRGQQSRRGDKNSRQPPFLRRPFRPFVPAERELLSATRETGNEIALFNPDSGVTYRPLDQLTDSDEAEMDISGDEDSGEPSHKRTRVADNQAADANSVPKWSNPDPYTALPPSDAAAPGKKRDIVQLIRKARVTTKDAKSTPVPEQAEDFISFETDESEGEDEAEFVKQVTITSANSRSGGVPNAPRGPRSSEQVPRQVADDRDRYDVQNTQRQRGPPPPSLPPPPLPPPPSSLPPLPPSLPVNPLLGSRKRTHDDVIKVPNTKLGIPPGPRHGNAVVDFWAEKAHEDPTPWMVMSHSNNTRPAVWLHKEIVDFYEYVRPRDFEERVRTELIDELKRFCRKLWPAAEVYPFGSFPTGLFLPTSDMDLVVLSDQLLHRTGPPVYNSKKHLFQFGNALLNGGGTYRFQLEFISKARVPLVKFVDGRTCLKVDISFEQDSGLQGVKTFNAWKQQYPAMPILVTLVKHLLCMRGLNEPVNGGIGGFSVICLVVSMLQMMPQVQSENMETLHHLGDLFMQFLDLYGNKFDYRRLAISLNPPRYMPKSEVRWINYRNNDRLSIIDPNNESNDISGGASHSDKIVMVFRETFITLQDQLAHAAEDPVPNMSLLRPIFGGDYSSFRLQRNYLEQLANGYRPPPSSQGPRPPRPEPRNSNRPANGSRRGGKRGRR